MSDDSLAVQGVSDIMKAVVRQAPQQHRKNLWAFYEANLDKAQQHSATRMPWEEAASVTHISRRDALSLITEALRLIKDDDIAVALVNVAAEKAQELDRLESRSTDIRPPGKLGTRNCSLPGCTATFNPQRSTARYCSPAHRQAASRQRRSVVTPPAS